MPGTNARRSVSLQICRWAQVESWIRRKSPPRTLQPNEYKVEVRKSTYEHLSELISHASLMLTLVQPLETFLLRRGMLPEVDSNVTSRRYITEVAYNHLAPSTVAG